MDGVFNIGEKYLIDTVRNTISDKETNEQTKVEQRFISVLCILADNPMQLVTRERLIKEVWDDYGGADDGLTQAISFLRKILNDSDKKVIETIPKKGYILHAEISKVDIDMGDATEQTAVYQIPKKSNYVWATIIILSVIILIAVFYLNKSESASPDVLHSNGIYGDSIDTTHKGGNDIRPDLEKRDSIKSDDIR